MIFFRPISKKHVDEEILELCFDIELLIREIDDKFVEFLRHITSIQYFKEHEKNKNYHSILKVYHFFKAIKEDFGHCFSLRENKKYYNFEKSPSALAEKNRILNELKVIRKILTRIKEEIDENLNLDDIKNSNLIKLEKELHNFKKQKEFLKIIEEHEKDKVITLLNNIIKDAFNNAKKGLFIRDNSNKHHKLLFSAKYSISDLKILDITSIIPIEDNIIIRALHKDKTLPIYHYNIIKDGKDIHVIPKNLFHKLKKFLVS